MFVLIEAIPNKGFRAWSGGPLVAEAEGASRQEALDLLRSTIQERLRSVECVKLQIETSLIPSRSIWPDDELTRDFLAELAEARERSRE